VTGKAEAAPFMEVLDTAIASSGPCSLCGAAAAELVFSKSVGNLTTPSTFSILRCRSCGLVRTEPRLTNAAFELCYRHDYWGRTNAESLDWVRRDQRHRTGFLSRFRAGGSVLDVGCGLGLFLRALDPAHWNRYGVEPMSMPYQEAARWLGPDRISRSELTVAGLPAEQFDVVTFWDSLEHLSDPRPALDEAFRLLRPQGLVLVSLPNFESYQARHFREDWFELSVPYHLYHYTPASVTRLLETCGFRVLLLENGESRVNYHSLKHSLLNRLTRIHGRNAGRLRYYLSRPFLRPWEWISTRLGGGSSMRLCAEVVKPSRTTP